MERTLLGLKKNYIFNLSLLDRLCIKYAEYVRAIGNITFRHRQVNMNIYIMQTPFLVA